MAWIVVWAHSFINCLFFNPKKVLETPFKKIRKSWFLFRIPVCDTVLGSVRGTGMSDHSPQTMVTLLSKRHQQKWWHPTEWNRAGVGYKGTWKKYVPLCSTLHLFCGPWFKVSPLSILWCDTFACKKKEKEVPPNLSDETFYHCNHTAAEERNLVVFLYRFWCIFNC